jgi:DNA polymerase
MNDPTRFDLDARQRAMLAEMGVRVWMPEPLADVALSAVAASPVPVSPVPISKLTAPPLPKQASTSAAHPSLPSGLAEMEWAGLQAAAAVCEACGLCAQRTHSVVGVGSAQAQWLVVGDAPGSEESASGQPFAGEAGRLLDNMLKAVGLSRTGEASAGVYVMHATQCPTPDARNPSPEELRTCSAYLSRKVALIKPRVIVAMGRFAMQALLQTAEPLGKMRGQVHHYQGVPVVVTYPPAYLLRNQADKGKAWADLCLALKVVQESA